MTQRTDTDISAIADTYRAWSAEMEREAADVAAGNDTVKPDRKRARLIRGFAFIARRAARQEELAARKAARGDPDPLEDVPCSICHGVRVCHDWRPWQKVTPEAES